jgi:excisionase family DNA binding protein
MSNRTHDPHAESKLYSIATVAERLDVSQDTVRRLIANGELTAIRIGSCVRVEAIEFESFLERRREPEAVARRDR